jgi:hypothetical protein
LQTVPSIAFRTCAPVGGPKTFTKTKKRPLIWFPRAKPKNANAESQTGATG